MVDSIEICPSNKRAICRKCQKKIKFLEIRGVKKHSVYANEYICNTCLKIELSGACGKIEEIKKDLEKFRRMDTEKREDYLRRLQILKKL